MLALPSFAQGPLSGRERPLRMAAMGPTLLDEVPLLPGLLLCELYLLEQSVQVHAGAGGALWPCSCQGSWGIPTALPSGLGLPGLGQAWGHG